MVPGAEVLPDTLPTERLQANGRPAFAVRGELRRIQGARNALTVVAAWLQTAGVVVAAPVLDRWWGYLLAFALMGRGFALLNILGHEAAHRLLFRSHRMNDLVGRWLLSYPAFTPFDRYRRAHMAHHQEEMGPKEPDAGLYAGYPITRASLRRKLVRDAIGISGWKNLRPLLRALTVRSYRRMALRIWLVQAVLLAACIAGGRWWLYPLLWLGPWLTVWRVLNRLRAIAEHGGLISSPDRRLTTHVVRQRPWARFWMVPYNTGWHLAHHVDIGIPWRRLPRLHAELVAAGWVTPALEYPSYVSLWRALASGDPVRSATSVSS